MQFIRICLHACDNSKLDKTHEIRWPADKSSGLRSNTLVKHQTFVLGRPTYSTLVLYAFVNRNRVRHSYRPATRETSAMPFSALQPSQANSTHAKQRHSEGKNADDTRRLVVSLPLHVQHLIPRRHGRAWLHRDTALTLKVQNTPSGNTIRFHTAVDR